MPPAAPRKRGRPRKVVVDAPTLTVATYSAKSHLPTQKSAVQQLQVQPLQPKVDLKVTATKVVRSTLKPMATTSKVSGESRLTEVKRRGVLTRSRNKSLPTVIATVAPPEVAVTSLIADEVKSDLQSSSSKDPLVAMMKGLSLMSPAFTGYHFQRDKQ